MEKDFCSGLVVQVWESVRLEETTIKQVCSVRVGLIGMRLVLLGGGEGAPGGGSAGHVGGAPSWGESAQRAAAERER